MEKTGNLWLKQHQITAFWHQFGISNGLLIKSNEIKKRRFSDGTFYEIPAEVMKKQLKEYIKWLKEYKKEWNYNEINSTEEIKEFEEDEKRHESRADIKEMIELLQDMKINN